MSKYTLLIGDHDNSYCGELESFFANDQHFNVLPSVHRGDHIVEVVFSQQVDVLLLDIVLPKYDGIWVMNEIAKMAQSKRPLVIINSAVYHDDITRRVTQCGAAYYFIKPFDFDLMRRRVLELLCDKEKRMEDAYVGTGALKTEDEIQSRVTAFIHEIGIPAHLNGYQYIRSAIIMAASNIDSLRGITTMIYPAIAKEFNTTPSRVERAIRHAIEVAWNRGSVETLEKYFGFTINDSKGKPTNGEFIAMLADCVQMHH